jgi:23S rRNA pseudouridine2605 synthase
MSEDKPRKKNTPKSSKPAKGASAKRSPRTTASSDEGPRSPRKPTPERARHTHGNRESDNTKRKPYPPRTRKSDTAPYSDEGPRSARKPNPGKARHTYGDRESDNTKRKPYPPRTRKSDTAPYSDEGPRSARKPTPGKARHTYGDRESDNTERKPYPPRTHKSDTAPYSDEGPRSVRSGYDRSKKAHAAAKKTPAKETIRLNKYIANAGICSRREADDLIKSGLIEVNGTAVTEMGYQVSITDKVTYAGERISPEKPVYILMNKPKDFITTTKDPEGRRTVLSLIRGIGEARVYPVGRLDRNTTGLLLLTNDGALAKKLTHPSHGVRKLYHVTLDKPVKAAHMKALREGITLEDGPMAADDVQYVDGKNKREVGLEIHSGKNRIVRRMFEYLGYEVKALDRVIFAGLTKKDLPRGKWRHLTQQELNTLKML